MARLFDDAQTEYLSIASAVVSEPPFAVTCWVYCDDDSAYHAPVSIYAAYNQNWAVDR